MTESGWPAEGGRGKGVEGSGGDGVEGGRGEGVEGSGGNGVEGGGEEGGEGAGEGGGEGEAFSWIEAGARVGGEAISGLVANIDPGMAIARPSIWLSITLLFPANTSASRFLFPPTSKRSSPCRFAFFLAGTPSSSLSFTLFPSTCGSTAL